MMNFGDRVSDPAGSGWVLAAALGFFVAGLLLLACTGAGLGALHAFAGFIVLAIVAALNQLLPVLTHAPVTRPQGVLAVAAGFSTGFALLIAGFYGAPTFGVAGAVLAVSAFAWVAWNTVRLFMGSGEGQTRAIVGCVVAAFAFVAGIGASMAGALAGRFPATLLGLAPLHAALAILGFASLLVIGISYRFVPMFAVAHGTAYGKRTAQWFAVAGVAAVAARLDTPSGLRIALLWLLAVAIVIGRSHLLTLARRLRKRLDVSLRYAAAAWIFGVLALALALAATWLPVFRQPAIEVALLGWICITILGYAYKVAGFLAWQTAKTEWPAAQLPPLSSAVHLPLAYGSLASLCAGVALSAILTVAAPDYAQAGYDLYAAGGLGAVAALAKLAAMYRSKGAIDAYATRTAR